MYFKGVIKFGSTSFRLSFKDRREEDFVKARKLGIFWPEVDFLLMLLNLCCYWRQQMVEMEIHPPWPTYIYSIPSFFFKLLPKVKFYQLCILFCRKLFSESVEVLFDLSTLETDKAQYVAFEMINWSDNLMTEFDRELKDPSLIWNSVFDHPPLIYLISLNNGRPNPQSLMMFFLY